MAKRVSEDEFVNDGLTEDEIAASAQPQEAESTIVESSDDAATQPDPATDKEPQPPQPQTVDVRAVQEARAENRQLKDEYKRLQERTDQLLQHFMRQNGQSAQQEPQQPEIPDEDTDPLAVVTWLKNHVLTERQQREAEQQRQQIAVQQQQQFQAMFAEVDNEYRHAVAADPTVEQAYNHALQSYANEMDVLGLHPVQKQQQIQQYLNSFITNYAQMARTRGISVADYVKNVAKARGWADTQQRATPDNVRRIAEQQERHMSLSDASGGEAPKPLDAKTLASMPESQFRKLMSDPSRARMVDEIMGIA